MLNLFNLSKSEEERAVEIHKKSIVIDMHEQEPSGIIFTDEMVAKMREMLDAGINYAMIKADLWKMKEDAITYNPEVRKEYADTWERSGVTAVCPAVGGSACDMDEIIKNIARYNLKYHKWGELLVPATGADDIRRAKKDGKHAALWDVEDSMVFGFDIDKIDLLYNIGVRILTLTYNRRNFVGDGCTESYNSGLSDYGYMVIERLNKLGIVVDVSHCGSQTTMDAAQSSKDPVIASHTGCMSIYDHDRNKTDEEIKAVADNGGVIGIYTAPYFVGKKGTLDEVLDHIDHAVEIVGADHVGIGTDYGGFPNKVNPLLDRLAKGKVESSVGRWVGGWKRKHFREQLTLVGMEDWSKWPNITRGLVARGHSDKEIKQIIGGSMLRVLDKVIK